MIETEPTWQDVEQALERGHEATALLTARAIVRRDLRMPNHELVRDPLAIRLLTELYPVMVKFGCTNHATYVTAVADVEAKAREEFIDAMMPKITTAISDAFHRVLEAPRTARGEHAVLRLMHELGLVDQVTSAGEGEWKAVLTKRGLKICPNELETLLRAR